MPSVDELTALFRAISTKDWTLVETTARSVAARQEEKGHHSAARTLRGALVATNGSARSIVIQVRCCDEDTATKFRAVSEQFLIGG